MDTGVMLSVHVISDIPYSNRKNQRQQLQKRYDSDGEIGHFFDTAATQKDDEFDEAEHTAVNEASEESNDGSSAKR